MKRKLLFLAVFSCVLGGNVMAQQDRAITHFMYDKMSLNPGMTGINFDNAICGSSIYRNQWDKVNGAPNSAVLNVEANLNQYGLPGGVGVSFYHDAIGYTRQNTVVLNYSYHLPVGNIGFLGIGVGVGITNLGMNGDKWVPPTTINDPSLPATFSETKLDANVGLYLKGTDFYIGLSSTHIPAPDFNDDNSGTGANLVGLASARHYYAMGGYTFRDIGDGEIETNALVRSDFIKTSFDIGGRYIWDNKLYGGLSYRLSDAVGVMVGANIMPWLTNGPSGPRANTLTVGYSYDVSVNKLASVSRGSHEMMVKYCYFLPPIPIQKSHHPRWL